MKFELSLVDSGVIGATDLCRALQRQLVERPPLGQLAIEEGYLDAGQVRCVLAQQRRENNDRFGEIAIDLGFLNREQLATLLLLQHETQRPLAEYLIDGGDVLRDRIEAARSERRSGCRAATEFAKDDALTVGVVDPVDRFADQSY